MEKIPFEDGTKIKDAVVEINEQEYTVTAAQYTGNTPLTAANLNLMQDNIENTLVKVAPTQPDADIWFRKGKNLYNPETMPLMNGLNMLSSNISPNSSGYYVVVPIKGGNTYNVSKKNAKDTATEDTVLTFGLATTANYPIANEPVIDIVSNVGFLKNANIQTSENANFLFILLIYSTSTVSDGLRAKAIEELQVELGLSQTSYEENIEPTILVKNSNVDYEYFINKDFVYQRDLSLMKTSKVTDVTRAIEMVYGGVHFLNIAVSVDSATNTPTVIFKTDIIPRFVTELYATNGSRTYRCILDIDGKINLTNPNITGPTFLMITGVFML